MLALASGCGGGSGAKPDAAVDAAVDAAPTTVTLAIRGTNVVKANVPVSFADEHGVPTTQTMTDANGMVTATIAKGASVTFLFNNAALVTVTALVPGDALDIEANTSAAPTALGTLDVSAPTYNLATSFVASVGDGSTPMTPPTALSIPLDSNLVEGGKYDLLAYALDSGKKPIAYTSAFGQTAPTSGTTPVTLGAWQTDFNTFTLDFNHVPAATTVGKLQLSPVLGHRTFPANGATQTVAGTGVELIAQVAPLAWTAHVVAGALQTADGASVLQRVVVGPTLHSPMTVDASTMLPLLHDPTATVASGHAMPTLAVAADGALANAAGVIWQYKYATATGTMPHVVVTPAGTTVDVPQLGDALAAYRPATPFSGAPTLVYAANGVMWANADEFRAHWWRGFRDDLLAATPGTTTATLVNVP